MPDDLPRKDPTKNGPDYDDDFYAWAQHQATVLREMAVSDNRFDREHVAEEIEDLAKAVRNAVRSQVRRVVEHFLKLQYSPAQEPRNGWIGSIIAARIEFDDNLTRTLRRDIESELQRLYHQAKRQVELGFRQYGEDAVIGELPATCPYTLEQILEDDWYPEAVEQP